MGRMIFGLLLSGAIAVAQTITGTITGSVVDSSGLATVGADIRLTHTGTGAERTIESNERGEFVFSSLAPGEYRLRVFQPGFKTLVKQNIMLSASETLPVGDLILEVGAVSESVTVTAQGSTVQTASAERSGVVTSAQVENLMNRSRNVMSLLQILPGVVDLQDGTKERIDRAYSLSVQGNRTDTNNLTLDGMTMNAIGNNTNSVINLSQDAVAEVKVLVGNYQAEYGRMSGANVQVITKSGSREFHGLGSKFWRHEQFNAKNFFNNRLAAPKPRYRYHTWSYNIGGPAYIPGKLNRNKDKLFFFWSQEYWPLNLPGNIAQLTVPTELERNGDFSQTRDLNGSLIVVRDPANQQPFAGNRVPASRIEPNGQALLKIFPAPNFFDNRISAGRFNYVFQTNNTTPQRTETLKLDYNINSSNVLTGNVSTYRDKQEGFLLVGNWPHMRNRIEVPGNVYIVRYQKILSPTLVNESNFGFSHRPEIQTFFEEDLPMNQRDKVGFRTAQFYPANNPFNLIPNATFGGVIQPATLNFEGRSPRHSLHRTFTLANNVSKILPAHTLKAGFYTDRFWTVNPQPVAFNGSFDFGRNVNNPRDTNYAYSNALLGVFNTYNETSARPEPWVITSNVEAFVQDNWKVSRKLTLDYGLRFYWIQPVMQPEGQVSGFDPALFDPAKQVRLIEARIVGGQRVGVHPVTGQTYPAAYIGAIAPNTGDIANGLVVPANTPGYPSALVESRGLHYSPRMGVAYDPFGKGKTAIRAGFGMFYNRTPTINTLFNLQAQRPIAQNPTIFYGTLANLASSTGALFPDNVIGLDRQGKVPTVMNFSASVQQHVASGTVVDIAYSGSLGRRLMWQRELNPIPLGANFNPANADPANPRVPLPVAFLRPLRGFNSISFREWAASSNYHSLQVSANRRFARGLQFGAAWTWSKSMDYNSGDADAVSVLVPVRVWNYGLSSFDRTHVVKLNWVWDLPKAPLGNDVASYIVNNWQVSGLASFVTGAPLGIGFTTVNAIDITGSASQGARVNVTGNPVLPKSDRTFSRNFRTEVFELPAVGTVGNSARSVIRGPGINNWDMAVFKNLPIRENIRMQLRAEAYNTFNHTQFSGVDTGARFDAQGRQVNARFGEFTAARQPRIMQFALRFVF